MMHSRNNRVHNQISLADFTQLDGAVIAALGNSGNFMGPHLHFYISDKESPLGSEGLPYIIKNFGMQITPELIEEVGILDFHPSETDLMVIDVPGFIKMNAIPMQNGVYCFNDRK